MILAGGRGSRLHDLTKKVAKPAVSYGGKYRIIDFPLSNCANSGIDVVSMNQSFLTVMSQQDAAGVLMPRTAVYTYFRRVRNPMQIWTYTEELQTRSPRISISSIHTHRSIF